MPSIHPRWIVHTEARALGGHERATLSLVDLLLRRRVNVLFSCLDDNSAVIDYAKQHFAESAEFQLEVFPPVRSKYPRFSKLMHRRQITRLAKSWKAYKADAVLVSQGSRYHGALGLIAADALQISIISYLPMAHSLEEMNGAAMPFREWASRPCLKIPDAWLVPTQAQADRLRRIGARQPATILPNPIPPAPADSSRENARSQLGIAPGDYVFGMAGRFNNRQKGCDLFAQACATLARQRNSLADATLLFVGDGEDAEAMLHTIRQSGWQGPIVQTGWVNNPRSFLAAYDLLVAPSRYEGFPLLLQEAVLAGTPVLTTSVDGLENYFPEKWIVAPNWSHLLTRALEAFFENPASYKIHLNTVRDRFISENNLTHVEENLFATLAEFTRYAKQGGSTR